MVKNNILLKDIGEKQIIANIIIPLINPKEDLTLAGDDCAVINISENKSVCISTDRVPSDLVSFKLGIINYYELGYYLAILNISDIVSSGAKPVGILLNFAFPSDFSVNNLEEIMKGAKYACEVYDCLILGGDLSDASEMNLVATSIGSANTDEILYRRGCQDKDLVFCSDYIGITATAFSYFNVAQKKGLRLSEDEEKVLTSVFRYPNLRIGLSQELAKLKAKYNITCMDNTDGAYQTLHEMGILNKTGVILYAEDIPIHPVSRKVAEFLDKDVFDIIFGAGADFRLFGTLSKEISSEKTGILRKNCLQVIGLADNSLVPGTVMLNSGNTTKEIIASGWNYYGEKR